MAGFRYRGKSTDDIIDTPLLLVSYESDGTFGSNRSKLESDITISRPVTNEYGTLYDPLSFSYALIKQNFEPYTEEEQVSVERWLISPKLSSELTIINCQNGEYSYFGLFTSTSWERASGGFAICNFTFQVNGAYPYIHNTVEITNRGLFTIDCRTDELEEYVYPTIIATPTSSGANVSFTLTNNSEPYGGTMNITSEISLPIHVDCKRCRAFTVTDKPDNTFVLTNLRFKDLNWQDVDNVYWPRLVNGENKFELTGNVNLTFDYYAPYKKVGGWLV